MFLQISGWRIKKSNSKMLFPEFVIFMLLCEMGSVHTMVEIKAKPYTDVVLPCSFPFVKGSENLYLTWEKDGHIVHSFDSNQDHPDDQSFEYRGRTRVDPKEFMKGNVSLLLLNAEYSDHGVYKCKAANLQAIDEKAVKLSLNEPYQPEVHMTVSEDGKKRLRCVSSEWHKVPAVEWHTRTKRSLTSESNFNTKSDGTISVESHLVEFETNEHYFCTIKEGGHEASVRAVVSNGQVIHLDE